MLALATCASARHLDTDLPALLRELPEACIAAWDDPTVDWTGFDTVVVRSTWNYHDRRDEFLAWCRAVDAVAGLWNPLGVLEWNTDKRYLADLASRGVPTVPTTFVEPGDRVDEATIAGDVVVKPTVGAGSRGVVRARADVVAAASHVEKLHRLGHTVMIQPYLSGVDTAGEIALVFLGGELSHAVEKGPILAGPIRWADGLYAEEQVRPVEPSPDELAVAQVVVAALPATAYARIDLLPGTDGPVVLEVELTEPSLFLELDDTAAARAAAVFRSLGP